MKYFEVNRNITIKCEWKKTRNGFKHVATLQNAKCEDLETVACHYLNRTWESFEYESVLKKLVEKSSTLSNYKKRLINKYIDNGARVEDDLKPLKSVAMIASLGDIFGQTKKEKNDWKARMIKAGLEGKGLIMPDDWNELDEDTKQARLDGVIEQLNK